VYKGMMLQGVSVGVDHVDVRGRLTEGHGGQVILSSAHSGRLLTPFTYYHKLVDEYSNCKNTQQ